MRMESPERQMFGVSMEGQESPLFNFLFTLSPIKPIRSLHASQSFTDLSFPPPPPVFVTPKVHVKSSLHRNSYTNEQTITLTHSNSVHNSSKEDVSCADQRSTESQDKSASMLCTSSSQLVEPQLAEGMEVESIATCSMDIDKKGEHMASSLGNPETLQNNQPLEPLNVVHLCNEALDTNKEAADLMPSLSEVDDKSVTLHENLDCEQKVTSSILLNTFDQHVSGYHHSFCGDVNKKAQGGQVDYFFMPTSTDCEDRKSTNAFREQKEGAANKVNFPVQRGFRRRCLDFKVSDCHWTGKGMAPSKSMQANSCSRSLSMMMRSSDQDTHVRILKERILETSDAINSDSAPAKPRFLQGQADLDDQLHVTCPSYGNSPCPPNILSGIGLHLNSLTGSVPVLQSPRGGDGASTSAKFLSATVGVKSQSQVGLADKHDGISPPANFENMVQSGAIFEGDLAVSLDEKTELVAFKDHILSASEPVACAALDMTRINQSKEYVSSAAQTRLPNHLDLKEKVLLPVEHCQIDLDGGQDSCITSSAKNTRKRALTADSFGDGCKRCNCKKSKCLKLYCECFAAGLFCIDSCSCHDCHNKPSYEAMILETRQNIQSRNPLAFAPKILRTVSKSPTIGERAIDVTPASARHKKGCSCKKSKCLKKYCECYQEGVGCSEGCRCENCENLYGRKEGSEGSDGKDVREEDINGKEVTNEKLDTSGFCSEFNHAAQYRQDDLTPITPSFQYTGIFLDGIGCAKVRPGTWSAFLFFAKGETVNLFKDSAPSPYDRFFLEVSILYKKAFFG